MHSKTRRAKPQIEALMSTQTRETRPPTASRKGLQWIDVEMDLSFIIRRIVRLVRSGWLLDD